MKPAVSLGVGIGAFGFRALLYVGFGALGLPELSQVQSLLKKEFRV